MAQFARPDSDISTGSWTTAPLWQKIDEVTPNDSDFIQAFQVNTTCELGLSDVTDPESSSGHIIRVRARRSFGFGQSLTARLFDGATQIASFGVSLGLSFATSAYTLTATEANNIGDYTDLRLKLISGGNTGLEESIDVSWCEFEVPDITPPTQIAVSDSFSGSSSVDINAQIPISDDTLSGSSSLALQAQVPISDELFLRADTLWRDALLGRARLGEFRLGDGGEWNVEIQNPVDLSDSLAGAELLGIERNIAVAESLAFADAFDILRFIAITASATGAEALDITAQVPISDALSFFERKFPEGDPRLAKFRLGEAQLQGALAKLVDISANVGVSEAVAMSASVLAERQVIVSDSLTGTENIAFYFDITASDNLIGAELVVVVDITTPRPPRSPKSFKVFKFVTQWHEDVEAT